MKTDLEMMEKVAATWKALYYDLKEENATLKSKVFIDGEDIKRKDDTIDFALMTLNDCWLQVQSQAKMGYPNPTGVMKTMEDILHKAIEKINYDKL